MGLCPPRIVPREYQEFWWYHSRFAIEAALTGNYREEMVFILHQELSLYEFYQQQIGAIDAEIEQCLAKFPSVTEKPPPLKTWEQIITNNSK